VHGHKLAQPIVQDGVYSVIRYIHIMKHGAKTLASVLITLALVNGAQANTGDSTDKPYHGIVARNVFDVHAAPPPPPPDPNANRPPPPAIKLQGITDILGKKQVIMKATVPAKAGSPAKEEAFILSEGQRQGEITVLSIDVKGGSVEVDNYGMRTNLTLEANGEKLASSPMAPAAGSPLPGFQQPSAIPLPPQPPSSVPGKLPQRTLRLPNQPQSNSGASVTPNGVSAAGTMPGSFGANPTAAGAASPYADPNQRYTFQNADEQELMIEAQRLKYQQDGDYRADLMPPTRVNPTANTVRPQHQQQQSY
jgi:hypothetical protein